MSVRQGIFLTGATGLIGRYILRDLLGAGYHVAVLIRNSPTEPAPERLDRLLAFGEESLNRKLPRPTLIQGDLNAAKLGLGMAERHWLAHHARSVIHSAAYVAYSPTPDGEPWKTNVNGLLALLELCRSLGLHEVHYLSTAFVCGDRRGVVREDELDCGEGSGNAYEQSKFAAEQSLRDFPGIQATIYRPSIVVGDSRTGYTSTYHHFYRFLELAVRLFGRPAGMTRTRRLTVRLPLSGEERQNIVPVDWVSRAVIELAGQPYRQGRTYHLVARRSVTIREITAIVEDLLQFKGIQWVGGADLPDPTSVEQVVLEQFRHYWSYLRSDVIFDFRKTRESLPDLPPPDIDRDLVARLLRFAQSDGWGRERARSPADRTTELSHYLEDILPAQMQQSRLAEALPLGFVFVLEVHGRGGGRWTCRCGDRAISVRRGAAAEAVVTYRLEATILDNLIHGRQTAKQAFLKGHIEIDGDMEKAVKLAMLIEHFLAENLDRSSQRREELYAAVGR
jgi:thioester reductase-like protein